MTEKYSVQRSVSRGCRSVLDGFLLLSIFSVVVIASSVGSASSAPTPRPTPEGELRIGVIHWEDGFDPIYMGRPSSHYLDMIYDSLTRLADDGTVSKKRGIAEDWACSKDAKIWTFKLRKGIRFHNGDEVTAEDAKFSLERTASQKSKTTRATVLRRQLDRVEILDQYTVAVHLKQPNPFFDYDVVSNLGRITPKKYIEDKGEEYFAKNPIGSGPYRVAGFTAGYSIELEAVDWEHFDVGVPRFKRVVVRYVPEESTRVAMLKTGELDGSEIGRKSVPEAKAAGLKVFQGAPTLGAIVMLVEQYREDSPLNNEKVRRALALAIDKESIFKTLLGGSGQVNGAILGVPRNPPPPVYPYDPGRAKQLLAEAGYPQGFPIDVYANTIAAYPEGPEVMQAVARYWSQIGLKVKIIPIDWNLLNDRAKKQQLGVGAFAFSQNTIFAAPPNVGNVYFDHFHPNGVWHHSKDPNLVRLIEKVMAEVDPNKYLSLMEEMGKYAYDHVLAIKIADVGNMVAANPNKVRVWVPYLDGNVDRNIRSIVRR